MIPQIFIHDLLNRVEIVDVIDRHVALKKAGANYSACCPFHNEKTPSFTVSPTKQFYHCFGCKAHGNAISFLMEYSGMDFVDAVTDLATGVGLQLPVQQINEHISESEFGASFSSVDTENDENNYKFSAKNLFEVMTTATRYYREQLKNSEEAIAYLKKRGLTGETANHFALGYAPADWQNLKTEFANYQAEISENPLSKTGLVVESDSGKIYDRFRNRIMFPILNQKGIIVGFGGRVLDQGEPKYLNSPETALFTKGRELYNLFAARRAIHQAGCVLVVEGYMDVVALYQFGIEYTVASLGTATTSDHLQKLLRHTDTVIFCFDGDVAGKKAAWRALENSLPLLRDGKQLSFLFLPDGEDPDSYVNEHGTAAFEALLKKAVPLSNFLFQTLSAQIDLQSSEGRTRLVRDAKPLLKQVTAPILSLMLLQRLTELSGVSQNELQSLLQIKRIESPTKARARIARQQPATPYYWLIQILLYQPVFVHKLDESLFIENERNNEETGALKALIDFLNSHPHVAARGVPSTIVTYFNDSPYRDLLEKIEAETLEWDETIDLDAEFCGALASIQQIARRRRMVVLQNKSLSMLSAEEKLELKQLAIP